MDWKIMYEISLANMWSVGHMVEHEDDADDDAGDDPSASDPIGVLVGKLLNVDIETVDDTMFLSTLGLDSLSASKLSAIIQSEFNATVTQLQLLGPVSISALRQIVADAQGDEDEAGAAAEKTKAPAKKPTKSTTKRSGGDAAPSKVNLNPLVEFNLSLIHI